MLGLKILVDAFKGAAIETKTDAQACVTELVCCRNADGRAFFAYIRIKPDEYLTYRLKLERGEAVNPNRYEILEYGWGEEPPLHIRERMQEKHGVDHAFENKRQQLLEEAK